MKNPALRFKIVFWGAHLVLLTGIVVSLTVYAIRHSVRPALPLYASVPEFTLIERSGKPVTLRELRGKIWVADFIFTSCSGLCPPMSRRMSQLQKSFANDDDVRLVSFSVDPERDTPQVLAEYADRYSASKERWLFLTGEKKKIYALAQNGFFLPAGESTPELRKQGADAILHSAKFSLVDRTGRVRGYYDGEDADSVKKLETDVEILRHEKYSP